MLRRVFVIGICLLALPSAGHPAMADGVPTEKFSYTANFEERDPMLFWTGSKDYTINFKGLTDEKCLEGKKCLKLDITFGSTSHIYWTIPMPAPVPAEGNLKFTGNVYLGEGTTADRVEIGPSFSYPPSTVNATCPAMYNVISKGKWIPMQGDLAAIGRNMPIRFWAWGEPDISNAGIYLTDILLRLYGKKGDRVIIYLDDYRIEGDIPQATGYAAEITKRWAPIREKVEKKAGRWQAALDQNAADIEGVTTGTDATAQIKKDILAKLSALRTRVNAVKIRGAMESSECQQIDNGIRALGESKRALITQVSLARLGNVRLAVTTIPPVTSVPVMPTGLYGTLSSEISVTAAQGEFEPASFIIHSMQGTNALTVKVGDLKQGNKIIPASNIDIKVVKCWYQAGTAWYNINQDKARKILVPELLLNDDTLVKVDTSSKDNYLKLSFPDGERYTCISDPNEAGASAGIKYLSVKNFPVKDNPALLPVDIPANENRQFWITVKVPENAAPGKYTGKISLTSAGGDKADLTLSLNVLPFKLPKPYYDSSLYYRGYLDPKGEGSISSEYKSRAQLAAELADMVNHGVVKPTLSQGFDDKELLKEHLAMRKTAGIDNDPLYYDGFWTDFFKLLAIPHEGKLDFWKTIRPNRYKEFLDFAAQNGVKDVYFYAVDEAKGDALSAQRDAWTAVRNLGGKIFVAGTRGENFQKMGDIQDLFICAFYPHKEEADLWHSAKHKIWCYFYPQGGVEDPEINRRNYGILIWQNGYDGPGTYAYQHAMGNVWNDFDDIAYRDHNFTYPTVNGIIDTIAWEGYREGVDDVRYVTKLQQMIAVAEKSKDKRVKDAAERARAYLKTIDAEDDDLNAVRSKIIGYIMELR